MQVDLRESGRRLGRLEIDLEARPTKVLLEPAGREVVLDWNSALDDSQNLRRCVSCGGDLFRQRHFPRLTGVIVVLAFAGGIAGIAGFANTTWMLSAMAILLGLDIAVLLAMRPRLECYTCGSRYSNLPIAHYHQRWDPDFAGAVERRSSGEPSAELRTEPQDDGADRTRGGEDD
ncbi:MAG: hypothetical protein QGH76_06260 [Phycisphaerales bacterium]|nr:hypothetical protein [Phycisphaerales bacterium]